jgi:undecaprenyl-diphosphatase
MTTRLVGAGRRYPVLARVGSELGALDRAVYRAVAVTPTPTVDVALSRISNAANYSGLWLGTATLLSLAGRRSRRAAVLGVAAIGVTSAVVNLGIKPVLARKRPLREDAARQTVLMPRSHSFPSGHSASAFAFSSAVGAEIPELATPLRLMATTVAYSRLHNGVHYLGDVIAGALIGAGVGTLVRQLADRTHRT